MLPMLKSCQVLCESVSLSPVGANSGLLDSGVLVDRAAERVVERLPAVAGPVVSQCPGDPVDAVRGEELHRPMSETRCGDGLLITQFLGVRQPGAVLDRGVHERVPRSLTTLGRAVRVAAPCRG